MAPLKALKVTSSSTAHWVAGAQAAIRRGVASARAGLTESVSQGGAVEATPTPTGEGAPPPHEGKVSSVAEATEVEARRVSEAEATDEAAAAEVEAPVSIEATMAGARAHGTTDAGVVVARPSA